MNETQLVLVEVFQFALDLAGILDPTGIADGTSAAISLWRGEWVSAGISAVSIIPYVGDLAKAAKLPKYAAAVSKAIRLAVKDAKFANELRPIMRKLLEAIDKVPGSALPDWAAQQLRTMRKQVEEFLERRFYNPNPKHEGIAGNIGRQGTKLDLSADEAYLLLNDPAKCLEVAGKKQFVAVKDGKIYVFQPDNAGLNAGYHAYPATGNEVAAKYPEVASEVARMLGVGPKQLSRME